MCPPEGDAGTGMAATNSVLPRTGNVSAGTSIFAMLVLDKPLKSYYPEIDVVTTPGGAWGMALLAAYSVCGNNKSLPEFLDSEVFVGMESTTLQPEEKGAEGFRKFMENYKRGLAAEYAAAK